MNRDDPDVLMLTLQCTEHPQCTENLPMYLTDIIRDETIQIVTKCKLASHSVIHNICYRVIKSMFILKKNCGGN